LNPIPYDADDLILFRLVVNFVEQVRPDFQRLVLAAARLIKLAAAFRVTDRVLFPVNQEQGCSEGSCLVNYPQAGIHDACEVFHTDFWMDKRILPITRCSGSGPA